MPALQVTIPQLLQGPSVQLKQVPEIWDPGHKQQRTLH